MLPGATVPLLVQEVLLTSEIPIRNNYVHFMETLHSLAGRVAGTYLPENEEYEIHRKLVLKIPREAKRPKYTAMHLYAACSVQVAIRGFMMRRQLDPLFKAYDSEFRRPSASKQSTSGSAVGIAAKSRWGKIRLEAVGADDQDNHKSDLRFKVLQQLVMSRLQNALEERRRDTVPSWPSPEEIKARLEAHEDVLVVSDESTNSSKLEKLNDTGDLLQANNNKDS